MESEPMLTAQEKSPLPAAQSRVEPAMVYHIGQWARRTVNWTILATWSNRLVGLVVKASALRAEGPGFESRLRRDFFGAESYQWLKHWHSSGYPARCLAL